jgi:hypothetical protein
MAKNLPHPALDFEQTVVIAFEEPNDAHRVIPIVGGSSVGPSNPLNVNALPFNWDYFEMALSVANTRETYTFKTGGSGGTTTGTVELNYTTSTRDVLANGQITVI